MAASHPRWSVWLAISQEVDFRRSKDLTDGTLMHERKRPYRSHRTTYLTQRVQNPALTKINSDEIDECSESDESLTI